MTEVQARGGFKVYVDPDPYNKILTAISFYDAINGQSWTISVDKKNVNILIDRLKECIHE